MLVAQVDTLSTGLVLYRHYDNVWDITQSCGDLAWYDEWSKELDVPAGMLAGVTLHIWADWLTYDKPFANQGFWTWPENSGSTIYAKWGGAKDMGASLSHEMGHAFWTFTGVEHLAGGENFINLWDQQAKWKPWPAGWGYEEYLANAWRYFFGSSTTRGIDDGVPDGVYNPKDTVYPAIDRKAQLQSLPKLCEMFKQYSIISETLTWQGNSWYRWQRGDGRWCGIMGNSAYVWDGVKWESLE